MGEAVTGGSVWDVLVIGAGAVGSFVARELSRFELRALVIEKEHDVSMGASRANSGVVHAGHDAAPGTKKALFNVLGQRMFDRLSRELDFPFARAGSIVAAHDGEGLARLRGLMAQGEKNGLRSLRLLGPEEALRMEPNLNAGIAGALFSPEGGITSPYEMTIAAAENAASNGVAFMLGCKVLGANRGGGVFHVATSRGSFAAAALVNAAGVFADEINNMLSEKKMRIAPRRGEYLLFDKSAGGLARRPIFQLPTSMGKGVLVAPTVHGNLLIGPNSRSANGKDDVSTTAEGLAEVCQKAGMCLAEMPRGMPIASFAGLRAHHDSQDFIVEEAEDVPGLINLCGIASPGLTAAPALGQWAAMRAAEYLGAGPAAGFNPTRIACKPFAEMSAKERRFAIRVNPDYGQIVCRCEHISKAEVAAALNSPLSANSLDAIKRRTRAGMGRCQGGFCWARLVGMVAQECGIRPEDVTKAGPGTNVFAGRAKESYAGR